MHILEKDLKINQLSFYFRQLEKEKQIKSKVALKNEIVKN